MISAENLDQMVPNICLTKQSQQEKTKAEIEGNLGIIARLTKGNLTI